VNQYDNSDRTLTENNQSFWMPVKNGVIPKGVNPCGHERNEDIFVARVLHEGDLIPGKAFESRQIIHFSVEGKDFHKSDFEVFVGPGSWVETTQDNIPPNAVAAGKTKEGEKIYIGRVSYSDQLMFGKVMPSKKACFFAYDGVEKSSETFEIFVNDCVVTE